MIEGLVVRRARREDWRSLKAIRLEALSDTPDAYGSTYEAALDFSDERWITMVEEHCYFLVEGDARVLGMVSGGFNSDHPGTWWLYGMFVTPEARGSRAATMLVDAVSDWARDQGAEALYLHVTMSVERARAFYRKLGFTPNGESFTMPRDSSLILTTMRRDLEHS